MIDWLRHLRVRPEPGRPNFYAHPGMWLTRGDYSDHASVRLVMRFDSAVVGPFFCWLDLHRWITTWRRGVDVPNTRCWYCRTPKVGP